jgi:hypothetical protein
MRLVPPARYSAAVREGLTRHALTTLFEHLYSKRIVGTGRGSTNPRLVTVGGSGSALAI